MRTGIGDLDERKDSEADDYDFEEGNAILDMMSSLVHMRNLDGGEFPSYSFITPITDTFGLDDIDVIKLAKENGYAMFRVIVDDPDAEVQGGLVIADPDIKAEQIRKDFEAINDEKAEVKEFGKKEDEPKGDEGVSEGADDKADLHADIKDIKYTPFDSDNPGLGNLAFNVYNKKGYYIDPRTKSRLTSMEKRIGTRRPIGKTDRPNRDDESLSAKVVKSRDLYDESFHSVKVAGASEGEMKKSPLPLDVIPNNMGINLSSVKSVDYNKQKDGQLKDLKINFIPASKKKLKAENESASAVDGMGHTEDDVFERVVEILTNNPMAFFEEEMVSAESEGVSFDTFIKDHDIPQRARALIDSNGWSGMSDMINWDYIPPKKGVDEKIEKHDTLNPALWDNDKKEMLPEVRDKLLEIANAFIDGVHDDDLDLDVDDIVLIGSNANYNYTEDSDLDIHIIASSKPDCNKKHLNKIYQAYKSLFNGKYDMTVKGYPAEVYVEMDKVQAQSGGIYSIKDGKWLKEPKQFEIPDYDKDEFEREFSKWEDRYFDLTSQGGSEKSAAEPTRGDVPAVMEGRLSEEPDRFGLPTDDEIDREYDAKKQAYKQSVADQRKGKESAEAELSAKASEGRRAYDEFIAKLVKEAHDNGDLVEINGKEYSSIDDLKFGFVLRNNLSWDSKDIRPGSHVKYGRNYVYYNDEYMICRYKETGGEFYDHTPNKASDDFVSDWIDNVLVKGQDFGDYQNSRYTKKDIYGYIGRKDESLDSDGQAKASDIDKYIDDLYDMRKDAIAKGGEFSIGNLVFKELRNLGYLDSLKQMKTELMDQELSLEGLDESKEDFAKFKDWCDAYSPNLFDRYMKQKERFSHQERDIYFVMKYFSQAALDDELKDLEATPTSKEKDEKGKEGAELVYEDSRWKVYRILNYDGASKYGKNSEWCISGCRNENGKQYWDDYTKSGDEFYFFIDNKHINDPTALELNKSGQYAIYDSSDTVIGWIPDAPKVKGLPDVSRVPPEISSAVKQLYGKDEGDIRQVVFALFDPELEDLLSNAVDGDDYDEGFGVLLGPDDESNDESKYFYKDSKGVYHDITKEVSYDVLGESKDAVMRKEHSGGNVIPLTNRDNIKSLMGEVGASVGDSFAIISSDVASTVVGCDKKSSAFIKAANSLSSGIKCHGMWKGEPQPDSFIIKVSSNMSEAKALSESLCQLEFVGFSFPLEGHVISKVWKRVGGADFLTPSSYLSAGKGSKSSKVLTGPTVKSLDGYTVIDADATDGRDEFPFSFGLYGSGSTPAFLKMKIRDRRPVDAPADGKQDSEQNQEPEALSASAK